MPTPITTGAVHHLRLTVSDVARSRAFYTEVLGFQHVMDLPVGVFLSNGTVGLGIGPSPNPSRAPSDDRFDEARVGLDHLSFGVASREELERARQLLDERGFRTARSPTLGMPSACTSWPSAIPITSSLSSPPSMARGG
jgi:glyoxylase I family protein